MAMSYKLMGWMEEGGRNGHLVNMCISIPVMHPPEVYLDGMQDTIVLGWKASLQRHVSSFDPMNRWAM